MQYIADIINYRTPFWYAFRDIVPIAVPAARIRLLHVERAERTRYTGNPEGKEFEGDRVLEPRVTDENTMRRGLTPEGISW